ncbi:MAG: DUF2207 domain-containing protein [Patescibacteria group bacterium]
MKRLLISLVFLFFIFLSGSLKSVNAEEITSYQNKVAVNKDGTIQVTETISYDFGMESRHGIFRYIPFVKKNDAGTKYRMDIRLESVRNASGASYPYKLTSVGEEFRVQIGDKDKLITGMQTYVITYRVKGALTYFPDYDELYWNSTGNGWEIPIRAANTTIELPTDIPANTLEAICYTGPYNNTAQNCTATVTGNTVDVSTTQELVAHDGLTFAVKFPKGFVAVLEPVKYVPFSETPLGQALIFLLFTLAFLLSLWWYVIYPIWIPIKWLRYGRDPTISGPATAWYSPPKNKSGRELTPSETGTIIDERVDMNDICASIVDLARRGYLKIVEKKKGDFTFVRLKDSDSDKTLQKFEQELLGGIFGGKPEVRIKDKRLYETVEATKKLIYTSLTSEGFFPINPDHQRKYYLAILSFAVLTMNIPLVIVCLMFGLSMPRKTIFGKQQSHIAESLRRFLVSQERQLEFQAKEQYWFEKLLPYAVAFGVEKVWAKRFEKIDITPPDWYQGHGQNHFNTLLFVTAMNNSFSSVRTSSLPPSSTGTSSGFSGGFSGGGGGGGGGGSW